jgi:hypothetical protein
MAHWRLLDLARYPTSFCQCVTGRLATGLQSALNAVQQSLPK